MSSQNINQYVRPNLFPKLSLDAHDMSLTNDETDFNQEVVFSPFLIAQTHGNRLPFYFDINNIETAQNLTLNYKNYNPNNIFVSQNYYNPNDLDLTCFSSQTSCDIGLTGVDNGLVRTMTGQTITFTNGLLPNSQKFSRLNFDRRLKLFQVTANTDSEIVRFSGFPKQVLYEVVSKFSPFEGTYHELYGGFYQGFYRLFGYDYDIFPERMNKGWSIEMILKPRLKDEFFPNPNETTLNKIYPNNKNTFFYFGTRAENKFYHHADGTPNCFTGYTRDTSPLSGLSTCSCCNKTITNSRCIFIYPPRSEGGVHDSHVNYGCDKCGGKPDKQVSCGCGCDNNTCENCGWECQTHKCDSIILPTPTPTPSPTPNTEGCVITPQCTPSCTVHNDCDICPPNTGFTSVEDTCEKDPLYDAMSNAISFRLCGDPKNPKIGVRMLLFTGDCETTGTCSSTGVSYNTGFTVVDYCSEPIYPDCLRINPEWLNDEHWFQINAVWERYTWFDDCDLLYKGGLGDITKKVYLESLSNNSTSLITIPYTRPNADDGEKIEIVNLNEKWLLNKKYRKGRLKIYINGKIFWTIEDFEELIPRSLNTDKEKQVGVPFNVSWGGGTQGLRENVTFRSCSVWDYSIGDTTTDITYVDCLGESQVLTNLNNDTGVIVAKWDNTPNITIQSNDNVLTLVTREEILYFGPYQQDPENFPTNDLTGTTFNGLKTNIQIEQNFAGTFEGAISQFRMYITPLSAPEVKHNFLLLKNTFRMFNPDCPDCSTLECLPDDFTTGNTPFVTTTTTFLPVTTTTTFLPVTTTSTTEPEEILPLGRVYVQDLRDNLFLIENRLKIIKTSLTSRYWDADGWWGNQGNTPQCVGYSWAHWIDDGPVKHNKRPPTINPTLIYREAQKLDEWPGENYDGTSVRGGAKYLKNVGMITSYLWTYDINVLINTVLTRGPVVVGTNWYLNMFKPNKNGLIKVGGRNVGGHAYIINGVDTKKKLFRIKNSWGKNWGKEGFAFISFSDMKRLINERGEVCLAIENPNYIK
jgi:hypothetical protein